MVWLWAVVAGLAVGLPAAMWAVMIWSPARPSQSPAGPRPRLDRVDRWLYDRYPLRMAERWRVRQAVLDGRELSEPSLRQAAHDLAAALLTGQVGGISRKAMWMMLAADGCLIAAILAFALVTSRYSMLSSVIIGLPLMAAAIRSFIRTRQRVERAHLLNQ